MSPLSFRLPMQYFKRALAVEFVGRQVHFALGPPTLEVVAEAIGDVVEHLHDVGVAELTELDHALMLVGVFPTCCHRDR